MLDAKTEQALSNGIKDVMRSIFWKGKQKANLPELEDSVKRLEDARHGVFTDCH